MVLKDARDLQNAGTSAPIVISSRSGCAWTALNVDGIQVRRYHDNPASAGARSSFIGNDVAAGPSINGDRLQPRLKVPRIQLLARKGRRLNKLIARRVTGCK